MSLIKSLTVFTGYVYWLNCTLEQSGVSASALSTSSRLHGHQQRRGQSRHDDERVDMLDRRLFDYDDDEEEEDALGTAEAGLNFITTAAQPSNLAAFGIPGLTVAGQLGPQLQPLYGGQLTSTLGSITINGQPLVAGATGGSLVAQPSSLVQSPSSSIFPGVQQLQLLQQLQQLQQPPMSQVQQMFTQQLQIQQLQHDLLQLRQLISMPSLASGMGQMQVTGGRGLLGGPRGGVVRSGGGRRVVARGGAGSRRRRRLRF
ncbi:hypothetical protein HDE_10174 [Halotydeus destructor]|nr:hypothetical protein HDE_10174 [Halotydeus destructor]